MFYEQGQGNVGPSSTQSHEPTLDYESGLWDAKRQEPPKNVLSRQCCAGPHWECGRGQQVGVQHRLIPEFDVVVGLVAVTEVPTGFYL